MSDMTNEEAIDLLDNLILMMFEDDYESDYDTAFHMAIDALKAQADGYTVSRQAAVEICFNGWNKNYREIAQDIKDLPPSPNRPKEPHWISCEERLPEKEVDVLCCRNNKTMDIMHFNPVSTTNYPKGFSMVWDAFSWRQDNVIAWMPLPEPYKGVDAV